MAALEAQMKLQTLDQADPTVSSSVVAPLHDDIFWLMLPFEVNFLCGLAAAHSLYRHRQRASSDIANHSIAFRSTVPLAHHPAARPKVNAVDCEGTNYRLWSSNG
jgi:hypothetical protein